MPARPAHINVWGCLLFAAWVASFGVYIAVRAAKTIDRHSNIFAYQVPCCEAHGQTYALLSQQCGYCTKKTFRTRIQQNTNTWPSCILRVEPDSACSAHKHATSCLRICDGPAQHDLKLHDGIKTTQDSALCFNPQVIILIVEAVGGLVTGQQGIALLVRLTSSATQKEKEAADAAELVASGKVGSPYKLTLWCIHVEVGLAAGRQQCSAQACAVVGAYMPSSGGWLQQYRMLQSTSARCLQSRAWLARPPLDLPYALAPAPSSAASAATAASSSDPAVTARNTSAFSIVPPPSVAARTGGFESKGRCEKVDGIPLTPVVGCCQPLPTAA